MKWERQEVVSFIDDVDAAAFRAHDLLHQVSHHTRMPSATRVVLIVAIGHLT